MGLGSSVSVDEPVQYNARGVFRFGGGSEGQRHRTTERSEHEDSKVQGNALVVGTVSPLASRADSSDSRSDGNFQFPLCQTERLHSDAAAIRFSSQNRCAQ